MKKKLIEVALPLEAINKASAREKSIRHGHPSTLHMWWSRKPLATARAVIFAQMVDDPSSLTDLFPTEQKQQKERERLFRIIEDLVKWENTTDEVVLDRARTEIWQSWRRSCAENADHPNAKNIFARQTLPPFHDPFAGGGSLPLEAQRLGLESYASDLNPVSVVINKAMIDIPPRYEGYSPINPKVRNDTGLFSREWKGTQGLAEDVRYYGQWMREEAQKRIGKLYPPIKITADMVKYRPELNQYLGEKLTVIAWLWARTVKSPNPAFSDVDVPLASTFMLSTRPGKEAYVEPVIEDKKYRFTVKSGRPKDSERAKLGTKVGGSGTSFFCLMSGTPMPFDYLRGEAKKGRMGARLMAIVAEGEKGRVYLAPDSEHENTAASARPVWIPDSDLPARALGFRVQEYGMTKWADLFSQRQLVALSTFSDIVGEAIQQIRIDAIKAGLSEDTIQLDDGGSGATAYAEAVGVYLGLGVSRSTSMWSTNCWWQPSGGFVAQVFTRQAVPMIWISGEANPFSNATGNWTSAIDWITRVITDLPGTTKAHAVQRDATAQIVSQKKVVSTDPPYYDNIGYSDLSDFYYCWQRKSLRGIYPDLYSTVAVPKAEELVATPYRHGSKKMAEVFFLDGVTKAMRRLVDVSHPGFPATIYYAYRQSESETDVGTIRTGWETFLEAVVRAGFTISGTWPVRTERPTGVKVNVNALASSIVLVCRKQVADAPTTTRREFVSILKSELPIALRRLQEGNIAPVDLAQAAIGPGMAVYTRFGKVLDAKGNVVPVREALGLINQILDETLTEQEGDFDADSRFALAWFEQNGFDEGEFGAADVLARAKNTSVEGLCESGILNSKRGKVRLFRPNELPQDWDPSRDDRLTHWETVHHMIRVLESEGESGAAHLFARLGNKAETARELAYRLFTVCERKKRAGEGLSYNALVQSFPEVISLASDIGTQHIEQTALFDET